MRAKTSTVAAATLFAFLAGVVGAGTIVGTPKSDVLRGTAKADKLYGQAGNDKLYGQAGNDKLYGQTGNDVLVGGAGADLLVCGPGRDVAYADVTDTIRMDCEVVKGLPEPVPSPPPPPQPPPPPPMPPPAPRDGAYGGKTSQLEDISFEVAGSGTIIRNLRFKHNESCDPPGHINFWATATGTIEVAQDGTWSLSGTGEYVSYPYGPGEFTATVSGKLDTSGGASGRLRVDTVLGERRCTSNDQTWTARIP